MIRLVGIAALAVCVAGCPQLGILEGKSEFRDRVEAREAEKPAYFQVTAVGVDEVIPVGGSEVVEEVEVVEVVPVVEQPEPVVVEPEPVYVPPPQPEPECYPVFRVYACVDGVRVEL